MTSTASYGQAWLSRRTGNFCKSSVARSTSRWITTLFFKAAALLWRVTRRAWGSFSATTSRRTIFMAWLAGITALAPIQLPTGLCLHPKAIAKPKSDAAPNPHPGASPDPNTGAAAFQCDGEFDRFVERSHHVEDRRIV